MSRKFPVHANTWDELVAAHERHERVRLEDVRPDMPAAFVDVIERALRPEPSQRYASAGEMLAAMRAGDDSGPLTMTTRPPVPGHHRAVATARDGSAHRVARGGLFGLTSCSATWRAWRSNSS